uniref:Uncharacterized protein n=1 Tax=Salix viminalis TaxID=40686 RepID=A0A6N2L0N3_SALVM
MTSTLQDVVMLATLLIDKVFIAVTKQYIMHMFESNIFIGIAGNTIPIFYLTPLHTFRSFLIIIMGQP